jgi:vacuolar-type H+-ATPase subunit H
MRIIAFPGGDGAPPEGTWVAELDAALSGRAEGPAADSWRELREDVRSLAPPASPELMQRLEREFAVPSDASGPSARRLARLQGFGRPQLAGAVAVAAALVVAAIVVGFGRSAAPNRAVSVPPVAAGPVSSGASTGGGSGAHADLAQSRTSNGAAEPSGNGHLAEPSGSSPAQAGGSSSAAPGRAQQLAASVSLSATPANVQAISDGVARLAVRDEGFVEDSHVQVQQHGSSEATLTLRLPSARLSAALAAIGRLAPVSAESQSLQDITNAYDAARQRLADATAERQALLRALARATTEGQIDSLRERLSQSRSAIAQARSSLQAVSQRASTAEVEVTVLGDSHATSEGLTLHRGLHDAGRVLTVALIVLLIGAAALVPLALLIAAATFVHRAWRRYSRERVLQSP